MNRISAQLHIVHIVAGLWKDTGGPAEVIPNLCRAQVAAGAKVTLCSIAGDTAPQVTSLKGSGVDVQLFPAIDKIVRFSPEMARYVKSLHSVDIIHNHGHWLWPNWFASAVALSLRAKLVTTPHGTLVPGMLESSSVKKWFAWRLFDKRIIDRADIIHALSGAERDLMAPKLGPYSTRKVRVIANGVHKGENTGQHTRKDSGTLLFLSRVAPIKGLVPLLLAWQRLAPRFPGWDLKIIGPIDQSFSAEVTQLVDRSERAVLVGPIYSDERWKYYRDASAFILPTFGEGLPTVLLEAAAYNLPIITTIEANFDELNAAGGSILTHPTSDAIEATLSNFFKLSGDERKEIGDRGAALVSSSYGWSAIASQWLSVYSSLRSNFDNGTNS